MSQTDGNRMHSPQYRFVILVLAFAAAAPVVAVEPEIVRPDVWAAAQQAPEGVKVWVMFVDKALAPAPAPSPMPQVSETPCKPRAIERRRQRRTAPGLLDKRDARVADAYIDAVRETGATVHITSRWLNAVSATATAAQIRAIGALPFVRDVQLVGRGRRVVPPEVEAAPSLLPAPQPPNASTANLYYGSSYDQLNQINAIALHNLGYSGAGVVLAVLDTGFYKDHESIQPERILAEWDFVNNDGNTQNEPGDIASQHTHGTRVVSIAAGRMDGMLYGPAYNADLILCKTEDMTQEAPIEEDWFVAGLEFAESHGADVITSSLGYVDWYTQADLDGQTAVTTVAVNIATENGVVCCTAAGNSGGSGPSLIAPADAFDVITVGAVDSSGIIASFSSRGPTADGRVKPEVVARGVSTWGAYTSSPTSYSSGSGTSFSTPLVAGVVACLLEAHPNWSVAQVRTALFETADYYVAHGTFDPAYARGYGLIDALAAVQRTLVAADFDLDSDVDLADFAVFHTCFNGPNRAPVYPSCGYADLDNDGDVDLSDFSVFSACFNGPNRPPCCD